MPAFWPHADSLDWWDGPDRFKRVNRCEVAAVQTEAIIRAMNALAPGKKIDMGGPSLGGGYADPIAGWEVCNVVRTHDAVTTVCDACATPFESATFAAAFTSHSIEHMHDPVAFLKECERLLRPGGVLYVVCPDKSHHRHCLTDMELGVRCYNEWLPEELLSLFRQTLPSFELLSFNTRLNNFDFEICARKPGQ